MSPIVIQKYGGSSVATIEKIEAVADRVVRRHAQGYGVVVVVSAMAGKTDALIELATRIMPEPPARELDMILSTGERTTMALLSIAIQKRGVDSISFTGSQSGIVTNDSHAHARIISVRPYRIQDELERGKIVIVAGFQGTSYKNEITTLGRGGSDMTAVALAGALSAESCEIYSDVDGVYTADPRVVLDARKLDELTSAEMLEMSQHGAKVLHDEAILYAHRHQIALYAKKTHDDTSSGTWIRPDGWPDYALKSAEIHPIAVVSAKKTILLSGRVRDASVFLSRIEAADGVKVMDMALSRSHVEILLDVWNCADAAAVTDRILSNDEVSAMHDVQNVTIVGHDLGRNPPFIAQMHKAVVSVGVEPLAVFMEPNGLTFVVRISEVAATSRALHAFVVA